MFRAAGWEQLERRELLTAAATITWTGGSAASANWSDPANWDLGRAPIDGDSLVFPAGAKQLANNDDIQGLSVNSITFHGQGSLAASGYVLSGDDLTVGTGGIVDDSRNIVGTTQNAPMSPMSGSVASGDSNQIDFNVTLGADQSWANDDVILDDDLIVNGNVDNGGFGLTAMGPGIIEVAGQISGSGGLSVTADAAGGTPILELQSANSYTGGTAVDNGTLIVNGSTADASAVTVAGGRLGGTGTIGGKIEVWSAGGPGPTNTIPAGTFDPGAGPVPSLEIGTLSNTGGVTLGGNPLVAPNAPAGSSSAQVGVELGGTPASPSNDQLDSAGTVSLLDARLDLSALGGAGPFNPGQQFVIVQAGAPISGTFDGLPDGSTVSDFAQNFTISYANDRVTLTALQAVPATITWTGGSATSANWSDPANWDLGRAPIDGDSLVFPAGAKQLANNDDIAGLSVNSITFQGTFTSAAGGYTLSGDDLTVGAPVIQGELPPQLSGIADNSSINGATASFANQIDLNITLGAAQIWSIDDGDSYHHLSVNGNVDTSGFKLTTAGSGTIDVAGQISGSGSLFVDGDMVGHVDLPIEVLPPMFQTYTYGGSGGALTLDLNHTNTYTGGTDIEIGTVTVSADGALGPGGTNDAGTTVGRSGQILFKAVAYSTPEAITLIGGTLEASGNSSFSGPIAVGGTSSDTTTFPGLPLDAQIVLTDPSATFTLNGPTLANSGDGNLLVQGDFFPPAGSNPPQAPASPGVVINNVISGTGGLTVTTGTLALGAANTYQGPTYLFGPATLIVNADDAIPSASAVIMQSNPSPGFSSMELDGHSDTIGSLAGTQAMMFVGTQAPSGSTVDLGTGGTLITGGDNSSTTFEGSITGSGTLTKVGSGSFDLAASNTYTGITNVEAGTLIVDGSTADGNVVTVAPGATLGGTGAIGGKITIVGPGGVIASAGGTLDPGAGPDPSKDTGTLSNTGGVTFQSNAIVEPAAPADAFRLSDFAVQLGGTAANPANDQLNSAGTVAFVDPTFLDLTTLAGAGPFNAGQQFVIVQAGAPISGTFDGLPDGSTVSDFAQNFTISYANDRVTLTALPVSGSAVYLNGQAGDGTAATFVHNLYRELLGREPDAADQAYWVTLYGQLMATGSTVPGSPTAQQIVVSDFLGSAEYRAHLVEGMYENFLHRAADAAGLAFWINAMGNGGDEKWVLADILGSGEYFGDAQPRLPEEIATTPKMEAEAWVGALYRDLLGRTPDAGGLDFWTQQALNNDTPSGRATVAFQFLGAPEVEQKLLNGNYPGAAGSVGAPGTPAVGAYALAEITGNGWDNLYFQGNLSAGVVDALFAELQAGEFYGETIAGMLDMQQYFAG